MKAKYIFILLISVLTESINAQTPLDSIYFGFDPPGDSAIIFAPNVISLPYRKERTPNYLPDYSEFYFSTTVSGGDPKVYSTKYTDNKWEVPTINPAFPSFACDLSITDSTLACFTSNYGNSNGNNTDIWIIERINNSWQEPYKVPGDVNSSVDDWGACILHNRTIYVCKYQYGSDVFRYRFDGNTYPEGERMSINSGDSEWDPFVAEDESYIIFKSNRSGGYGDMDLYISYKKEDSTYTNPKNLGGKINTSIHDDCGNLTPDGKYFMFGRNNRETGEFDIYWVSSNFIDSLKYTNFTPYVKHPIPNQTDTLNNFYSYTIPNTIFFDDDGNETLTYSVSLIYGGDLPDSLTFNTETNTISGKLKEAGIFYIEVFATDTAGANTSDVFILRVEQYTSLPDNFLSNNIKIYPNPANQTIQLEIDEFLPGTISYKLTDMYGKIIKQDYLQSASIDISEIKKGLYLLKLVFNDQLIVRKIVKQ